MASIKNITTSKPLTNVMVGYGQGSFIGDILFPPIPVKFRTGKLYSAGKLKEHTIEVKPGAWTTRVDFDFSSATYTTVPYGLHTPIDQDAIDNVEKPISLRSAAVETITGIVKLRHEVACQTIAQNTAIITQTAAAAAKWNAGAATPKADVEAGKEVIRRAKGRYPTHAVIPPETRNALVDYLLNAAQITYGEAAKVVSLPPLIWGMKPIVPLGVKDTAAIGATEAISDIWDKTKVTLAIVEKPSLMYLGALATMRRTKIGPQGYRVRTWFDEGPECEFVECKTEEDELLVDATGAYIISTVL